MHWKETRKRLDALHHMQGHLINKMRENIGKPDFDRFSTARQIVATRIWVLLGLSPRANRAPMTHAEKVAAYRKLQNSFDKATQARIELALGLTKSPRKAA